MCGHDMYGAVSEVYKVCVMGNTKSGGGGGFHPQIADDDPVQALSPTH
jgi:hypothetical protein